MSYISAAQFKKRFTALILGGREFPKKQLDRHMLYISAILGLLSGHTYSENELNDSLRHWSARFGDNFGLDHVTLRRYLIDEGYLTRDAAGMAYTLAAGNLPFSWDPSLNRLDLDALITEALAERDRRKQQYMRDKNS